ncbi:MAG: hypothetical protein BGO43_08290 [Gammaproteobacteria bacterium 39-13]|nr:chorismate lyase [Gammaproteobacteria bacterium]OJV91670.1 MAG: hypothetical protein BGO43_08290 [Gammaproteobacteria bacterium 39-13]
MTQLEWVKDPLQLEVSPSSLILEWLTKPYMLSKALKRVCQSFSVQVLEQCFLPAFEDEIIALQIDSAHLPFVRQVFLQGDGVSLIQGRVVIPKITYQHYFKQFASLSDNPIGETMLYHNPDVSRDAFEYAHVRASHPFAHQTRNALLAQGNMTEDLWARRSIFWLKSYPLLVSEIFFPTLPPYCP